MSMTRDMEAKLDEIDRLIITEPDSEKRNMLSIFRFITSTLSLNTKIMEELEKKVSDKLHDHECKLSEHDEVVLKSLTTWKVVAYIFGGIAAAIISLGAYAYLFITSLDKEVTEQAIVIPRIEHEIRNIHAHKYQSTVEYEELNKKIEEMQKQINGMRSHR